jgi:gluconolactonase
VFAAPPVIKTEVFARLPDSLRARANPRQQSGVPRDSFLEGPSFDRAGSGAPGFRLSVALRPE